jgi:Tfp pilus assembly protein FimT
MSHRTLSLPTSLNRRSNYTLRHLKNFLQHSESWCSLFVKRFPLQEKIFDHEKKRIPSNYVNIVGLTLLELIMAISIASILTTLAIPNVLSEISKYRLNGAAQQVFMDLMSARMKAVSHNRKVKIFFTGDHQYKICQDTNNDGAVDDCEGNSRIINIQDNYKGITINSNNNPIFHPRGNASNLATINLTNSSGTKNITIAITGRIQIS